ncbi:hypothetical protein ACFQY7_21150 [Actinomadura luteofluorescens]
MRAATSAVTGGPVIRAPPTVPAAATDSSTGSSSGTGSRIPPWVS